jgi:hypothetical protein
VVQTRISNTQIEPPSEAHKEPSGQRILADVAEAGVATRSPSSLGSRISAVVEYGLIVVGLVMLRYTEHKIAADGQDRLDALNQLLSGDGLSSFRYSLIGPLFAAPMWWLGHLGIAGRGPDNWLKYYNLVLFCLGMLAFFLLLRKRVDAALLRRFLLLVVAGTMIAAHVTNFYGETFTAMTVGLGLLIVVATVHPAVRAVGWVATIVGTANTPAATPALGIVGGERSLAVRRLRYLLPALFAAVLVLGENWARRGNPLDQGYAGYGFDFPFVLGVLAILFSFGKGLVFFTPGMFLPIGRKIVGRYDPARIDLWRGYKSWMLFIGGLILVYASWFAWSGDTFWGPRFFHIAIFPASLSLAVWLTVRDTRPWTDIVLLAVLALSIWIGADSTIFEQYWPPNCYIDHTYCRFNIQDSRLWYPIQAWPAHLPTVKWAQFGYHVVVFLWLAAPVMARLAVATVRWVREYAVPGLLPLRDWRW